MTEYTSKSFVEDFSNNVQIRFYRAFDALSAHIVSGGSHTQDESLRANHLESILNVIAELDDNEPIGELFGLKDEYQRYTFEALAKDEQGLRDLMMYWAYAVRLPIGAAQEKFEKYTDDVIAHELEHASAVRSLGNSSVYYGLEILGQGQTRNLRPFTSFSLDANVTKLQYAYTVAAPTEPSYGDELILRTMGYTDKADVMRRSDK